MRAVVESVQSPHAYNMFVTKLEFVVISTRSSKFTLMS